MLLDARPPRFSVVENIRRKQIAWITAILELTSWKRQNLAEKAGVSPATLTKFFNDPKNFASLDHRTVERLAAVSPLPPYDTRAGRRAPWLGGE